MRRLAKFLKDMFTVTAPQRLPATSFEMTLHDALRICAGRVRHDDDSVLTRTALPPIDDCCHRSKEKIRVNHNP